MVNLSKSELGKDSPVLCFDLDGTLLDGQEKIHPADLKILAGGHKAVLFIPATGRTLESIKRTFQRNGLFNGRRIPLPLVLQNGSLLYNENEIIQSYYPFALDIQEQIIEIAVQFKRVTFLFMDQTETHILSTTPTGLDAARRYEFTTHLFMPASRSLRFSKIMCIPEQPGDLDGFPELIKALPLERAYSTETILELTPRGTDKGSGLRQLLAAMDVSPRLILAAGDGENDLPLCKAAHCFFAPITAMEKVKKNAGRLVDVRKTGLLQPMLNYATGNIRDAHEVISNFI